MSENNDPTPETQPVRPTDLSDPDPAPPVKRSLRERLAGSGAPLHGARGLIAATLAALIVGGLGGAAIHAAVDDDDHDRGRFSRGGHPGEMGRDFGGRTGGWMPGQLPPTPTPAPGESPSESSSS